MKMYALSLWQPWASLVVLGLKSIETRNWGTARRTFARKLVGQRLAIHAAQRKDRDPWYHIAMATNRNLAIELRQMGHDPDHLPMGRLLGHVRVDDARVLTRDDTLAALCRCSSLFGLVVSDPIALPAPPPCSGHQGFWHVDLPDLEARP